MIKHDWRRAFDYRFLLSVVVCVCTMYIIMYEMNMQTDSVYSIVNMNLYLCEYMLVFAMATVPYAHAFIEDFERKNIYQVITRTNLKKYIISKTATIFVSAMLVIAVSMLAFVFLLRLQGHEWMSDYVLWDIEMNGGGASELEWWWLLEQHYDWVFYLIAGFQMGLLAGIVALVASYVSLFVKNKMMIMVFPVICLYVMYTYLEGVLGYGYGIYSLFNSFQNDVSVGNHFTLRACITACIVYVVLSGCIYKRIERMIRHD